MIVQTVPRDLHRPVPVLLAVKCIIRPERRPKKPDTVDHHCFVLQQMHSLSTVTGLPCLSPPDFIGLVQRSAFEAVELVIASNEHHWTPAHFSQHFDPVRDATSDITDADQYVVLDLFQLEPTSPMIEMQV